MATVSDIRVVLSSLVVSVSDVVLNFVVALFTGSTVMLSQALQGLSDLITAIILYIGVRRSKRGATKHYQFGHGREVFFWVLLAGMLMFIGTGGMSMYFGWRQFSNPQPLEHIWLAFVMLVFAIITNGYVFRLSLKRLSEQHAVKSWWHQLRHSSIAETKATFLIDFLGTSSAVLGLLALIVFVLTGNAQFDGLGSMVIGLSMMSVSVLLLRDMRDLIVGRAVEPDVARHIIKTARATPNVRDVLDLRTMYLGSGQILAILEVHLRNGLTTDDVERVTDDIKTRVQHDVPEVYHIQVEIETPD